MDLKIAENEKNCNITYINNEFTPRMQQTKLDTTGLMSTSNICAIVTPPSLDIKCFNHENDDGAANGNNQNNDLFDNNERKNSGRTNLLVVGGHVENKNNNSGTGTGKDGNTKLCKLDRKRNCNRKNKRKRRRGKQKTNSTKPFKKDNNWKFQMPQRYRSNSNSTNLANMTNVLRKQIQRQRSIVPYNTNKFLMEEHLAEVPSALLTPNGRTRDSSFSVDSEDNYFFSLPEDEEEFLTKEFSNVYERARVERLENMNKQQLIEECLQMEDRCSQLDSKQHEKYCTEFMNKIKFLEEKIQRLNKENNELRRRLDHSTNNSGHTTKLSHKRNKKSTDNMSCSSEDSESDSSSTSSSSSSSCSSCSTSSISEYSLPCSPQSQGGKNHSKDITNGSAENMEADNQINDEENDQPIISNLNNEGEQQEEQEMQQQCQIELIQLQNQDENDEDDQSIIIQNNSVEQENCLTLNINEINEQEQQDNNLHNGIISSQRECTNDNN